MSEERRFSFGEILKNLFFPPRCFLCGALLPWDAGTLCPRCRKEADGVLLREEKNVFGCSSLYWAADYAGDLRHAMERFKFKGGRTGAEFFGGFLLRLFEEYKLASLADGIAFIPMPPERLRARGYNQAEVLADFLGKVTGLPVYRNLLLRRGRSETHRAKDRAERRRITEESYEAGPGTLPAGTCLLLVDDIVTTGGTMSAAARLLREKGAADVIGLVPLRTPEETDRP